MILGRCPCCRITGIAWDARAKAYLCLGNKCQYSARKTVDPVIVHCQKCDKCVDRVDTEIDKDTGEVHTVAYCHGDSRRVLVPGVRSVVFEPTDESFQ